MKHLVETKGDFMLLDPETMSQIPFNRPAVVQSNNFIEGRIGNGQLKLIAADIGQNADDAEFAEFWAEKPEMAVDAYLSTLQTEETQIDEDLMAEMTLALEQMDAGDFQKDGKPKVGALDKLVESTKVDTALRDAFWDVFNGDD